MQNGDTTRFRVAPAFRPAFWVTCGRNIVCAVLTVALVATPALAQRASRPAPAPEPVLTLEAISRDTGKWAGTPPGAVRWTEDGTKLHFTWNPERGDRSEWYELDVRQPGATPHKIDDVERRWLSSNPGPRNKAKTLKAYAFAGDLYLHDVRTGKTRQITRTSDGESNPRFSFDESSIIYQQGMNLYEWAIATGETRQITDIRRGRDPNERPRLSKQDEYLEKQQLDMFEIVKKEEKNREEGRERTKRERGAFPDPLYLKETETVGGLQVSPDGKWVTFVLTDRTEAARAKVPEMPKYVTKSGYTESERLGTQIGGAGRVKVGAVQVKQKLGVMSAEDGKVRYVDMGLDKREYGIQGVGGGAFVEWSDDGKNAFCVLRARDNKERWLVALDVPEAKARILDAERDDAWIMSQGPYGFLADNETIWFRSERHGYFHVYTMPYAGGEPKALTPGKWEVTSVSLSDDKSKFFLTTSETHPGERHLYWMSPSGGERTRVTTGTGVFTASMSADEKWLAVSHSNPGSPTDLYLMENKPGATMARLVDSYTDEFKSYRWRKFEIVTIPDADGHLLYARLFKPDKGHATRPAVIYVHGAGYAQSVFHNWGNFGQTPFFNVLLQAGYTVMDLDYRGSSGYGRDCRTSIYRNMGGKDIDSAVAAAKWLAETQGVDPRRIGIYGGSYGGFFTLMAQFKHPGVFAAGAALYPVTDWAHYNHPYTSNILNLPYEDDQAYRNSSPIYYAEGLKDRLLILHGMHDRNVHYQDTIRLVQRLIELKKTGWELATMPIEDHGWQNETSRLDSWRRIFGLFEDVLKRQLPPLPRGTKSASKASSSAGLPGGN